MTKTSLIFLPLFLLLSACASPGSSTPASFPAGTSTPFSTSTPAALPSPTVTSTPLPTASPTATPILPAPINRLNYRQLSAIQIYKSVIDEAVSADFGQKPGDYSLRSWTISPDGRYLAVGGCTSLATGTCYNEVYPGHAFLYILDSLTADLLEHLPVDGKDVSGLAFTPDSSRLVYTLCPQQALVWDLSLHKVERSLWQARGCSSYPKVSVSPDESQVALVAGTSLLIVDLASGSQLAELPAKRYGSVLPKYSADGSRLAVFSTDDGRDITVYDTSTWQPAARIHVTDGYTGYNAVDLSPDGRWIATAELGLQTDIQLWDAATGDLVTLFDEPLESVDSLAFNHDGSLLLASGIAESGSYQVMSAWDVQAQAWLGPLLGFNSSTTLQFTRDGTALLGYVDFLGPVLWSLPDAALLSARQALTAFLDSLAGGDYASAARLFKPLDENRISLQALGVDPDDLPSALEAVCSQSFQPCSKDYEILSGGLQYYGEYLFMINFRSSDGELLQDSYGDTLHWFYVFPQPGGSMQVTYLPPLFLGP